MESQAQIYELFRPFARMVAEELANMQEARDKLAKPSSRQLKGISGIMEIFQCSRSKASRIKESGIIDSAITNVSGRIFLVDEQKALDAMNKKPKGGRRY